MATAATHCRATDRRTDRGIMAAVNVHVRGQERHGLRRVFGTNDPPHLAHSGRVYRLVEFVSGHIILLFPGAGLAASRLHCTLRHPVRPACRIRPVSRRATSTGRWSDGRGSPLPTSGALAPATPRQGRGSWGAPSSPTCSPRTSASSRRSSTSGRARASSTIRLVPRRELPPAPHISRSRSSSRRGIRSRTGNGP